MGMAAIPYLMVAATAVSAYSAYAQGQAASRAADYNAKVAANNAQTTLAEGEAAAQQQARQAQQRIGAAVAGYGASGVQSTGSVADVLADSVRQATLDNATVKWNYAARANGYSAQAGLDRMKSSDASTAGMLGAIGQIGQGAASYYSLAGTGAGTPIPGAGQVSGNTATYNGIRSYGGTL